MSAVVALRNWFIDELREQQRPEERSRPPREPFMHGDDRPVILLNLLLAQSQPGDERNIKMSLNHRSADSMPPTRQWKRFEFTKVRTPPCIERAARGA